LTGGAFGGGLDHNIEDAYRFLVDNYTEGDEIFFFGFSRGAYTARSTVGLIRKCGLLRKTNGGRYREAYKLYRRKDSSPDTPDSTAFRSNYSHEVKIEFIGVWDTVGALGIPAGVGGPFEWLRIFTKGRYQFHDLALSGIVRRGYQAVGIDERRKPYAPALWADIPKEGQRIEQVWCTGVHMDIGGGYEDARLSNIAFLWMKEKAVECGVAFDEEYIAKQVAAGWNGTLHNSRTGIFRFMQAELRSMGEGKGANEEIHPAVVHRFKNDPTYKPANVAEYLAKPSPVVAKVGYPWGA
jgi:uncharacterized protein (DUF2235 family)